MKVRGRRGTTLLELLIPMAQIIVLLVILIPVFARARDNAHRNSCKANLKRIGVAMQMYAQEHHGHLPPLALNDVPSSVAPFAQPYGWADVMVRYTRSAEVFQCPSQKDNVVDDAVRSGFSDYFFNRNLAGKHIFRLRRPETTILVADGNDSHDGADARYNRDVLPQGWMQNSDNPSQRHLKRANYLLADGRVKWALPSQIGVEHSTVKRYYSFTPQ